MDVDFETNARPYILNSGEIGLATTIINGSFISHLPCVYISKCNNGEYPLDIYKISKALSGMAHIFVEPNVYFSKDLKNKTKGRNPYLGAVGIFFPTSENRRIILPGNDSQMKIKNVFNDVKNSLISGYIIDSISYTDLKLYMYKVEVDRYKNNNDAKELCDFALKQNEELENSLMSKNNEIEFLKQRIKSIEKNIGDSEEKLINKGDLSDSYEGQVHDIIIDALENEEKNLDKETRKKRILKELLKNNPRIGKRESICAEIKKMFSTYKAIPKNIDSSVKRFGLHVEKAGKHYKISFADYPELTCILPSTPSDSRSWLNISADMKKKIF